MATQYWLGQAADISQVKTITPVDTWTAADTIQIQIGSQDQLIITVGASVTIADICEMIANALDGTAVNNGETRTTDGTKFGEMAGLTISYTATVVTVTGVAGEPFTMVITETTAGDGSIGEATTIAAAGRNCADDADNWTGGTVPGAGDSVVFDEQGGDVDCKWNLGALVAVDGTIDQHMNFTGNIGLPDQNTTTSSLPFAEYRGKHLFIDAASTVTLGIGPGNGSGMIRMSAGGGSPTVNVRNSGTKNSDVSDAVELITLGASSVVNAYKGNVRVVSTTLTTLNIGYSTSQTTDVDVTLDSTATTVNKNGGTLTVNGSNTITTFTQRAGVTTFEDATVVTTADVRGGTVYDKSSGTVSTLIVSGSAVYDFSKDSQAKTVTIIEKQSDDCQIIDTNSRVSSLIVDCNYCGLTGVDGGTNHKWTRAAVD